MTGKKNSIVFLMVCNVVLSLSFARAQEVVDRIAAVVGEHIILQSELDAQVEMMAMQYQIDPARDAGAYEKLKKDVMNDLISQKVLLIKAAEDTVVITDAQVDGELESRVEMFVQQLGSIERLEEYFGMPISRLKQRYRNEIKEGLTVQTMQMQKMREVKVSRRDVEQFYNTMKDSLPEKPAGVHLRHILITAQPVEAGEEQAIARIQEIKRQLDEGKDFAELAKNYSEDPGTADIGGDLGFIQRGSFEPTLERAAFQLKEGEISDIIESSLGLHILQNLEARGNRVHIRHIFIKKGGLSYDEAGAIAKANEIREMFYKGAAFDSLAKEYSEHVETRMEGGDLGWWKKSEIPVPEFIAIADTLSVGNVSVPVKTQYGFHLIFKEDETDGRLFSLDQDFDEIKEFATRHKQQQVMNKWIDDLKENIYIQIKNI